MTRERNILSPRRVMVTALAVVASAGLLASCSSSGGSTSPSSSSGLSTSSSSSSAGGSTSSGTTVQVKNFSFEPDSLSVPVGTTVTWKFDDSVKHNVTDSKNTFKSKDLASGGSYSFKFNTAGTYNYICTIHQYMKATITVK
ncbi:cupredoxin family copper-binding protein [Jatrophihabitans sp.]|uniref:cupredoxin domain-containing protein n=1 Tax=Jatrophihabitans sp. TaxID=1932789 RepID=UPI0030C689E2|nr:Cupredoxin-like protein [Jatrophihabitans sp.]